MEINGKEVLVWLSITSVVCGFLAWFFMRLLDDRKDKIMMRFDIDTLTNELKKMEYLEKMVNEHESEINVLKEKTKKI